MVKALTYEFWSNATQFIAQTCEITFTEGVGGEGKGADLSIVGKCGFDILTENCVCKVKTNILLMMHKFNVV